MQINNIFKGVGLSFLSTVLLLIIFSLLLTYTNIPETVINPVIIIISGISILIGSSLGNIRTKKKGLLNGGFVGFLYMFIIYLISSTLNSDFTLSIESLVFILVGIVCGILGGIIGVNKKND